MTSSPGPIPAACNPQMMALVAAVRQCRLGHVKIAAQLLRGAADQVVRNQAAAGLFAASAAPIGRAGYIAVAASAVRHSRRVTVSWWSVMDIPLGTRWVLLYHRTARGPYLRIPSPQCRTESSPARREYSVGRSAAPTHLRHRRRPCTETGLRTPTGCSEPLRPQPSKDPTMGYGVDAR